MDDQGRNQDENDELETLRARIRALDETILAAMAERLAVARAIGRVKLERKLPIKDFRVEKKVTERHRQLARDLGLYQGLAEETSRLLIKYAVAAQDEFTAKAQRKTSRDTRRIVVIGGRGRMGLWLSEFFDSFGHSVSHVDTRKGSEASGFPVTESLSEGIEQADVVVLATPISVTASILDEIARQASSLAQDALIFDICSLKSPIVPAIERAQALGLKVASVHPMFGPDVDVLAGRNILICDTGDEEATKAARALFADTTANVATVPLAQHDELMSYVLGLSHLTNLILANALATSGLSLSTMQKAASTTFNAQFTVAQPVVHENQDLYYEIQAENACTPTVTSGLLRALGAFDQAIRSKDRDAFKRLMEEGRRWFDGEA